VQSKLADQADNGGAELTRGEYRYRRGILLDSPALASGDVLYAAEVQGYDGPWHDLDEDVRRAGSVLRYSAPVGEGRAHLNLMGYRNSWNPPDQVPQRGRARPDLAIRPTRRRRRRQQPAQQTFRRLGSRRVRRRVRGAGLFHRLPPATVVELHLFPR
jgi:hypothetical protein